MTGRRMTIRRLRLVRDAVLCVGMASIAGWSPTAHAEDGGLTGRPSETPVRRQQATVSFAAGDTLKLADLLAFAEAHSPDLRSAYARWEAAKEKIPQASSLPDARLTYGYFAEALQTRTGPQEQKIGLSQTLPWFGKLSLRERMAAKEADAVYQDYVARRLLLTQRIRSDFHEYAYLAQAIEINREHLDLLYIMESVAAVRFRAGGLSQITLIQIQVEQGKIEDRVRELEALRAPLSSRIYAALGMAASGLLPWPSAREVALPEIDEGAFRRSLLENNPSLRKLDLLRGKEDDSAKLAGRDFYPDITLSVERIFIDGGDDPMAATISINLPIWRGRLKAARREAIKRQEGLKAALHDGAHQLSAELDLVLYHFRDAERKVGLYRNTLIPKAQQAIDVALKGFETGKVSFTDLLDAQRSLLAFQLAGERELANTHKRLAEIEALTGVDVGGNHEN